MSLKYIISIYIITVTSCVLSQSAERSVVPIAVVVSPNNNAVQSLTNLVPLIKSLDSIGDILPVGLTSFAIPNRNWGQSRPPYQNGNSIDQFQRPHVLGNQHPSGPGNAQPNIVIIDRTRPHHHGRPRPHYPMQPGNQNQQFYPGWPMYNIQPQYPNQPMFNGNQPTYNGNQPTYNGNQPTYNGNQPLYNGNQPIYNGNQPIYNGNQPIYNGNQPIYNGNQPQYPGPPFDNGNQQYPPNQPENPDLGYNLTPPTEPNQPLTRPLFKPSVKPTLPVVPITQPTQPPIVPITQPPVPVMPITSPPEPSKPETGNNKKGDEQPEFDIDVRFGGGDS